MKRLHVHVGVTDLDQSIAFYSTLFGAVPSVTKPDYAKWMLDDPRVNFAISAGHHTAKGIEHLGIEADSDGELAEVYRRLKAADGPMLEEGATTCCYATSEKSWISDPDGVVWEAFFTNGEATVYGESLALGAMSANAAGETCPIWPGQPMTAHWGIEDPAAVEGEGQHQAFWNAYQAMQRRIQLFLALPLDSIDELSLTHRLRDIGATADQLTHVG